MSTNINNNILKTYIVQELGIDKLTERTAQENDISNDAFEEANVDEDMYLELNEIIQDSDLYEQFATMYVQEQKEEKAAKDKEKEKEEQTAIKDKNEAGV